MIQYILFYNLHLQTVFWRSDNAPHIGSPCLFLGILFSMLHLLYTVCTRERLSESVAASITADLDDTDY